MIIVNYYPKTFIDICNLSLRSSKCTSLAKIFLGEILCQATPSYFYVLRSRESHLLNPRVNFNLDLMASIKSYQSGISLRDEEMRLHSFYGVSFENGASFFDSNLFISTATTGTSMPVAL